jgi:hypothetical protein
MNSPLVVSESLVHSFKYWHEGMQQGIRYGNELYSHFWSYPATERLKAYDIAHEHAEQGMDVCITVSKTHYSIWLGLRSLNRAKALTPVNNRLHDEQLQVSQR